jgi:hypothetical protein
VLARTGSTPPSPPAAAGGTPDALERLRALADPANQAADALVESVRGELRREYQRGRLEGGAKAQAPVTRPRLEESDFQRCKRRLQRRLRHDAHEWLTANRQLRKTLFNVVLAVVVAVVGIAISMRVSASGNEKRLAAPVVSQ